MRFHETVHGVYFDDLDMFQILHNARYLLYFERTVGSFWQRLGWTGTPSDHAIPDAYQLVRVNHVEYLRPVRGICEVRVRVWVERLGQTSLTFGFQLLPMDEDDAHATGSRVMVRVDPVSQKPAPWTEGFRKTLEPYRRDLPASSP